MKKLKLLQQLTADGFNGDVKGGTSWSSFVKGKSKDVDDYLGHLADSSDLMIVGRKMADGFIGAWTSQTKNPDSPDYNFAQKMLEISKVVFSKTIKESRWNHASIATGELKEEVNSLKARDGKDIIVIGGTSFITSLIKESLIDEFHFLVNPVFLGNGTSIFKEITEIQQLILEKTQIFECGLALLVFKLKK